ncbi:MAG: hypothetical protein PWQ37_578 [Candidatus Petromonas sp.]|jgi:hypothetical protein|nr:hypothetical protein [Candidatus Petromonas sp.]
MKRLDIIIIVLVIVVSLVSMGVFKSISNKQYEKKYAEISIDGKHYKSIPLNDPSYTETLTVKTELGTNVIRIEDGGANIIDADCPDKICVKDGFISKPGEVLVCLPNKLVVEIKGQRQSNVDELSY